MTQEEKELVLKDISARYAYNDATYADIWYKDGIVLDKTYINIHILSHLKRGDIRSIKPYLRPISSMTEEECLELSKLKPTYDKVEAWKYIKTPVPLAIANIEQFDFFHSHHLDWRGLIPMGLALEAPEGMYKMED